MLKTTNNEEIASEAMKVKFAKILENNGICEKIEKVIFYDPPELRGKHMASSTVYATVMFASTLINPLHLFVKKIANNPAHADMIRKMRIMERESQFYTKLLPKARKFCANYEGCENLLDCFPKCLYGDDEMVVLENSVVNDGFVMLQDLQDFETAMLVLSNLAKFHATTFSFVKEMGIENFKKEYDLVALIDATNRDEGVNPVVAKMFENVISRSIYILQENPVEGSKEGLEILTEYIGKSYQVIRNTFKADTPLSELINHGDCWNNNMLFKLDPESGKAYSHLFVDLQFAQLTSSPVDLSYFIYTSVNPLTRKHHLCTLLHHYFDTFKSTLKSFNTTCPVTFDEFFNDFKTKLTWGLHFGLTAITAMDGAMNEVEMEISDTENTTTDLAEVSDQAISKWMIKNPDKAIGIADKILAFLKEFTKVMKA